MYYTGIGDEAGPRLEKQLAALKALGWNQLEARMVELEDVPKANIHDLPDAAFDRVVRMLGEAGVKVCCFGSAIANWGKKIEEPFDSSLAEARRAIPRMKRLGTPFVRIMSFAVSPGEDQRAPERFRRLRELVGMFRDEGLQPLHENCMNYGGMGWNYTLELLNEVPGLKLVFDTGNPIFNDDRSKPAPYHKQDAWEFYTKVKDHVLHVHVKDALWNSVKNDADYTMPGDGNGHVRQILADLMERNYQGGLSIEPHLAAVFHDAKVQASDEQMFGSFVEYGRRLMLLVDDIYRARHVPAALAQSPLIA